MCVLGCQVFVFGCKVLVSVFSAFGLLWRDLGWGTSSHHGVRCVGSLETHASVAAAADADVGPAVGAATV